MNIDGFENFVFFWSVSHLHLGVVELSYAAIGATMYNNILWDLFEVLEQLTRVVWVWKKNTETNIRDWVQKHRLFPVEKPIGFHG